jgi:hypothetical protein
MFGKIRQIHTKPHTWEEIGAKIRLYRRGIFKIAMVAGGIAAVLIVAMLVFFTKAPEAPEYVAIDVSTTRGLGIGSDYEFGPDTRIVIPKLGSIVILEEKTVISFKGRESLHLRAGAINAEVIVSGVTFLVETRDCQISVKGTQFVTRVLEKGDTVVDVRKGTVLIKSKKAEKTVQDSMVRVTGHGDIETVKDGPQDLRIVLEIPKEITLDREIVIGGRIENPSVIHPLYIEELRDPFINLVGKISFGANLVEKVKAGIIKVDASNPIKFSFRLGPGDIPFPESNKYTAKFVYYVVKVKGYIGAKGKDLESGEFFLDVKKN